jgi:hypothetical protein
MGASIFQHSPILEQKSCFINIEAAFSFKDWGVFKCSDQTGRQIKSSDSQRFLNSAGVSPVTFLNWRQKC